MKIMIFCKVITASLLVLSFNYPTLASPTLAPNCPPIKPEDPSYGLRDENTDKKRCEGLVFKVKTTGLIDLISISTGKINSYGKDVSIKIPQVSSTLGKQPDKLQVEAWGNKYHYLLNKFSLSNGKFSWKSKVLKEKNIPLEILRGLAFYNINGKRLYIPIVMGEKGSDYEFVFRSKSQIKFDSFQIKSIRQSKIVYQHPKQDFRDFREGETIFP